MINLDKKEINFIGHRRVFLCVSLILAILALIVIGVKGLTFGTEFTGGASITYSSVSEDVTEDDIRMTFADTGYEGDLVIQTTETDGESGYLIRTNETDIQVAENIATTVAETLGINSEDVQVSTIGANWGANVIKNSIIALVVSFCLIIGYVWIRYREYKMGLTAIVTILHDILIVIGVYALIGWEITPNTVAALLTIMGYSLYDTIVTFHRIDENNSEGMQQSFWTVANHSINQVLRRTINTTLTSIIPVTAMLVLGGSTLQDFALAMAIGLLCGSYSSFAVATPLYAIWKDREIDIWKQNEKYNDEVNTDTASICGYAVPESDNISNSATTSATA